MGKIVYLIAIRGPGAGTSVIYQLIYHRVAAFFGGLLGLHALQKATHDRIGRTGFSTVTYLGGSSAPRLISTLMGK